MRKHSALPLCYVLHMRGYHYISKHYLHMTFLFDTLNGEYGQCMIRVRGSEGGELGYCKGSGIKYSTAEERN